MTTRTITPAFALGAALLTAAVSARGATVVGDLARVRGVRENHLVGLGLVVGLNGTGDSTAATRAAVRRFAASCGFVCDASDAPNAALVVVTAELPPFLHPGARIDVSVSTQGDAMSLAGGTLISTPLWAGRPENVFVRAQGRVTGCERAERAAVGLVRGGGIVEKEVPPELMRSFADGFADGRVTLDLGRPSAGAASAIADAVRRAFATVGGMVAARAVSPGEVEVTFKGGAKSDAVHSLADVLSLPVAYEPPARIVINERTGTVAASGRIDIAPAAVTTGSLSVTVGGPPRVAEASPAPEGDDAREAGRPLVALDEGMTVQELVRELNRIHVAPHDVVSVLQGLVEVGALRAEVIVE